MVINFAIFGWTGPAPNFSGPPPNGSCWYNRTDRDAIAWDECDDNNDDNWFVMEVGKDGKAAGDIMQYGKEYGPMQNWYVTGLS